MTQLTPEHQDVLTELYHLLQRHVRKYKLGRVFFEPDLFLPDGRAYIPDIVYLSPEHMGRYDLEDKCIHGAPDLVVEATSSRPSRDRNHKFEVYRANQVPWYWLIDPLTLDVEEYRFGADRYTREDGAMGGEEFRPLVFPGLAINLAKLLADTSEEPPTANA